MSEEATIISEMEDGVLTARFNRPEVMNALIHAQMPPLERLLQQAARDPDVRVVVMGGSGKAFSVGADIKNLGAQLPDDPVSEKWNSDPIWNDPEMRTDRYLRSGRCAAMLHEM